MNKEKYESFFAVSLLCYTFLTKISFGIDLALSLRLFLSWLALLSSNKFHAYLLFLAYL